MEPLRKHSKTPGLSSSLFRGGVRDCPSCSYNLGISPSICPSCQCNLEGLDAFIQNNNSPLQTIMDTARIVENDDQLIRKAIKFSELKFPQLRLIFCTATYPEGIKASLIAWWMLNHSTPSTNSSWTGILLVDPASHQVTFQVGYDLEVFVNRQKLDDLLIECGEWFSIGEWAQGATNFFKELHKMLKKTHQEALKVRKNFLNQQ